MASASAQSLEEAANIATEFIYSLDNLPNEIRFICDEIKIKDQKAQEIQTTIETECARHIQLCQSGAPFPPNYKPPLQSKISEAYNRVHRLHVEKIELATKMVDLIERTRTRLGVDINRVKKLQGEPLTPEAAPPQTRSSAAAAAAADVGSAYAFSGRDPAAQISESLRSVMIPSSTTPVQELRQSPAVVSLTTATAPSGAATKKRRLTAAPSIKLPARSQSPAPPPPKAAQAPTHRQSRLSRQVHPPVPGPEEDAEGEEEDAEGEEDDEGEDDKLYCFCQKKSFGDMIACDSGFCPYEWFHISCVGLKAAPVDKWYCDACKPKVMARKARKK
ncbi:uncharacterized protein BT62DRAFT_907841 [Guyanagaster necrorhizus]|uniref:Chromatin modification-related protein n=1 Tax=Guyanagaster necrorhizus TaxID=856835 RepID=A0A9P8AN70_9AGAR|nr:uncharacterized protein BT62DRAFT_907841 [Guyanagaster necrorhizus MCA 3950]KAG7441575.1 hypothetical protein BT62DRAFT_907841 [Guyanagaster necrorhizus MCA 3950]